MTTFILPKEIKLETDTETKFNFPENKRIRIEDLQIEISCGFSMLNKGIKITIYGDQIIELPVITLSQMYKLQIDMRTMLPNEKGWQVSHLMLRPCQRLNDPISFGINSLAGIATMAFSFLVVIADFF